MMFKECLHGWREWIEESGDTTTRSLVRYFKEVWAPIGPPRDDDEE